MMAVDASNEVNVVKVTGAMVDVVNMVVTEIVGQNVNATTVARWVVLHECAGC